jgi:hypothetical protein
LRAGGKLLRWRTKKLAAKAMLTKRHSQPQRDGNQFNAELQAAINREFGSQPF